jgi:uncharacterized repeat protein (TIGR01451 family)
VNAGPSATSGVQFVDNLPSGVTFKSMSVDKAGITLQHANGKITGSLGTMAAGEVIIITIYADVKASATGTLTNEAEVSAPNEEYTLNNRDTVDTPVTPKIDLSITKKDNKDPVKPGEQFTYTVTVTNHGPSDATDVNVLDTLPANVSFVSASITPLGQAGQDVAFELGDLASGASKSFTITVQVAPNFTGTLLNMADVSANEPETDYDNNHAEEPTLVKADPATVSGYVYVDKNKDGVKQSTEKPLAGVVMTLSGQDFTGTPVTRTTVTDGNGFYSFSNLLPGVYNVTQPTQPSGYKDGLDTLGTTLNELGSPLGLINGQVAPDTVDNDGRDADALEGIVLDSGYQALDYNFGEQAITTSKTDFIRPLHYR